MVFHYKLCRKLPWRSQSHQNIKVKYSAEDSGLWSTNLPEWCQPAQCGKLGVDNNHSHEWENNTTVWAVWDLSSLTISQKGSGMVGIADSIWSADLGQQAMTPLLSHGHHYCLVVSDTEDKTGWGCAPQRCFPAWSLVCLIFKLAFIAKLYCVIVWGAKLCKASQ